MNLLTGASLLALAKSIYYKYDMAYIIESQWNLGVTKFSLDWALKYKH